MYVCVLDFVSCQKWVIVCVCTVYPSQCRFISRCLIGRKGKRIRELRRQQQQFEAWGRIESTHCMLYYSYITKVHGCTFEVFYPVSLTSFVFFYLFEIRRFDPVCEARSRMHLLTYTHKQTLRAVVDRLLSVFFISLWLFCFFIVQVYVLFAGIGFLLTCLFAWSFSGLNTTRNWNWTVFSVVPWKCTVPFAFQLKKGTIETRLFDHGLLFIIICSSFN